MKNLIFIALVASAGFYFWPKEKAPSLYDVRSIKLENELEVSLIHYPKAKKSAAAVNVGVGSMHNNKVAGLAHFVEHMLFLGTKEFPDRGAYSEYLAKNQGSQNASTAYENTDYFFTVNHDALDGALTRFSRFFTSPLFTEKYTELEKNAVDAENAKNVSRESRRTWQAYQLMHSVDHPFSLNSTGNLKSLSAVGVKEARAFYDRYYSANNMKLALYGNKSLDELEALARKHFSDIENKNIPRPKVPKKFFAQELPAMAKVKPFGEKRILYFIFSGRSLQNEWRSKSHHVLRYLFSRDGEGSLVRELKNKGWVIEPGAWVFVTGFSSDFGFSMELTQEGEKNVDKIVQEFFTFTEMLKKEGYKDHLYEFRKNTAALKHKFQTPLRADTIVTDFTDGMWVHNGENYLEERSLIYKKDEELFQEVLTWLRPENMNLVWVSKDHETNKKESFLGVEYKIETIPNEWKDLWKTKSETKYLYPPANNYLVEDTDILAKDKTDKPYKLIDEGGDHFWYQQVPSWKTPKARLQANIYAAPSYPTTKELAAGILLADLLKDHLAGWRQELYDAGINLSIATAKNNYSISMDGYSQHLMRVYKEALQKIKDFRPDASRFEVIKEDTVKYYDELEFQQPSRQGRSLLFRSENEKPHSFSYRHHFKDLTIEDIISRHKQLIAKANVFGVAMGNLSPSEVKKTIPSVRKIWGVEASGYDRWINNYQDLLFPKAQPLAILNRTKTTNWSWQRRVHLAEGSVRGNLFAQLLRSHWSQKFFTSLRTDQQLGYMVGSFTTRGKINGATGINFYIQSGKYDAQFLAQRAQKWIEKSVSELSQLTEKEFSELKKAIQVKINQPPKSLKDEYGTRVGEIFDWKADFQFKAKLLKELGVVKKGDFVSAIQKAFAKENLRQLSVYTTPENKPQPKAFQWEKVVDDIDEEKKNFEKAGSL